MSTQDNASEFEMFNDPDSVDPTVVDPLPFTGDLTFPSTDVYTQMTLAGEEFRGNAKQAIKILLDEIDIACAIPGTDGRIRALTKRVRNVLEGA